MKKVKYPDGIELLMENLWLRHAAGIKQRPDNVYEVDFPPPTAEEIAAAHGKAKTRCYSEPDPEELYGAWI